MAYKAQAKRLREVQRRSRILEQKIRDIFSKAKVPIRGGQGIHVKYGHFHDNADLQVDGVIPNEENPETIIFVTYTDPDKPGHSNENKLHLKLGELFLFKTFNTNLRCILVVGETKSSWLRYVLDVFTIFFDDVVFTWESNFWNKLIQSLDCRLKNCEFWQAEKIRRDSIHLETNELMPPSSDFRSRFYKEIVPNYLGVTNPNDIKHPTLRRMAIAAQKEFVRTKGKKGLLWHHLTAPNYQAIWQERSYFNPMEFTVAMVMEMRHFQYEWSVKIPTLLRDFGIKEARSTEDFGLFSETRKLPVYIQCKASGGGEAQHGKAVMNRSKEQIARSLLYRCRKHGEEIQSKGKNFVWIAILDGNWKIPQRYPLKYIHMLQFAGYDKIYKVNDLLEPNDLNPYENNPLNEYLEQIKCRKEAQITMRGYF